MPARNKDLDIREKEIIQLYQNGLSTIAIGNKLGVNACTIERRLRTWGIPLRKSGAPYANHKAFDTLTPEAIYWAGFIAGDGNISRNNGSLRLTLVSKDKEHLEKFRLFLSSEHKVESFTVRLRGKEYAQYRLRLHSNEICMRLIELGITEKKSLTLKINSHVLLNNINFLRGIVDSDGCISYRPPKYDIRVGIYTGSREFAYQIQQSLKNNGIHSAIYGNGMDYGQKVICYRNSDTLLFLHKMYFGCPSNTRLERKYQQAIEVLSA